MHLNETIIALKRLGAINQAEILKKAEEQYFSRHCKPIFSVFEFVRKASYGEYKKAKIEFKQVANLNLNIDFDILADNDFSPFAGGKASEWVYRKDAIVSNSKKAWNMVYLDKDNSEKPIQKTPAKHKIIHQNRYILFKIGLFGGVIEVLAKDFNIQIKD